MRESSSPSSTGSSFPQLTPMSDSVLAAYEAVPYQSRPIPFAEPDSIAATAILHGVTPPPPDRCRVLELGCASGGNLISMAFALPKSKFVGIDLAPSQVAAGQFAISEMGLQNIALEAKSIEDLDGSLGQFDYIICHGVYSWVPPSVQDAILRVCSTHLTPNGIAFVSYNTYPGWHRREILRDLLVFNDDKSLSPGERVARARELTAFLETADASNQSLNALDLRAEIEQVKNQTDHHLFHEQLETYNQPVYFAEFARRAAAYGLRYLAEATPTSQTSASESVVAAFNPSHDPIRAEQYVDFVIGRAFRRTLLCRSDISVASSPLIDAIPHLLARSQAAPVAPSEEDAARGGDVAAFRTPSSVTMTTNNPMVIAALRVLGEAAPRVVSFADLHREVTARLTASPDENSQRLAGDQAALAGVLLHCASGALVEFRALPSRFVVDAGNRPKASALARWQSIYSDSVTALGHWSLQVSGMERFLLRYLDGSNDRGQLLRLTERAFASGDLQLGGVTPTREQIAGVVDDVLVRLGRLGVLVA
jgi:SAM-dependent methyltransferase/methyltransferase-like protein